MYKAIITSKDFNYTANGDTDHKAIDNAIKQCPVSMNPWQARVTLYRVYSNENSFVFSVSLGKYLDDVTL